MTTIVAVKKEKRICIASDTLTLFGERKEIAEKHVYDEGKILQIGNNFIGIAGHSSWSLVFKHYFSKKKRITTWETVDQVFEVFNTLHRHLKDLYYLDPSYSRYEPLESSEFDLIIANSNGIFEVDYLRVVRQYHSFSAIGTGEEYALGAIKALYSSLDDVEEIAKMGIEAAAQFDRKTALPLRVHCFDV
ncbi:MAG: hypothetical protein Q8K75_00190 [Chlamydiales bacterium]|nr:hypothetical protein [Chlamydiales bacterium]